MDSVGVCGTIEKHGAYIFALQFVRVGSVTDANIVTEILIDENADEKREDHPQIKDKDNHDKHLNKWARKTSKENKRANGKSDTMLAVVIRCSDVMVIFSQRRFLPTGIPHLGQGMRKRALGWDQVFPKIDDLKFLKKKKNFFCDANDRVAVGRRQALRETRLLSQFSFACKRNGSS